MINNADNQIRRPRNPTTSTTPPTTSPPTYPLICAKSGFTVYLCLTGCGQRALRRRATCDSCIIDTTDIDVSKADEAFTGDLSLHYKIAIPGDMLAGLPRWSLSFDMPPEYVFRAVGVTQRP